MRSIIGWVSVSVLLGIATAVCGVGLLGVSADILARAALHPSIADLQVGIVAVRFFGLSRAVFRYLERLVSHSINFKLLADIRLWFFQKLFPLAPAVMMKYRTGDLLARSIDDLQMLEIFYVRVVSPIVIAGVMGLSLCSFFYQFHPFYAIIVMGGMLIVGLINPLFAYWSGKRYGKEYVTKRSQMTIWQLDSIKGSEDLAVYHQQENRISGLRKLSLDYGTVQKRLARMNAFLQNINLVVINLTLWCFLWVAIPVVDASGLEPYVLPSLAVVVIAGFEAIIPLSQTTQYLDACIQSAKRLFQVVDEKPEVVWKGENMTRRQFDIRIKGLTFRYPNTQLDVLSEIDLEIPYGKRLGIVGRSGSGKTTLINLLTRCWDIQPGMIYLENADICSFHPQSIRNMFGVLTQSPYIFSDTLRANMKLADPNVSDERIINVLDQVGLSSWLEQLPNCLDSWMGEHGILMSGGERQRLAIARILLQDAPIWLLDEPTSQLDPVNHYHIFNLLLALSEGKTMLYFSHNLIGMEKLDEIIVLDRGRIIEKGSHHSLMEKRGLYHRMYILQTNLISSALLE